MHVCLRGEFALRAGVLRDMDVRNSVKKKQTRAVFSFLAYHLCCVISTPNFHTPMSSRSRQNVAGDPLAVEEDKTIVDSGTTAR
jgi:hypothetical protein